MAEKPDTEERVIANRVEPILPEPPVPSQVRMSMVPPPPQPIPREENIEDRVIEHANGDVGVLEAKLGMGEEVDAKPKGIITIKVFENSPYEVEFEGKVSGSEVDMAWKAMMREYRQWKHNLFKKETADKNGGV